MFKGLMQNEFIKLFSKLKTYVILLLFIALSFMIVAIGEQSEKFYLQSIDPEIRISNLESEVAYVENQITDLNQRPNENNEDELNYLKQDLASVKSQLRRAQNDLVNNGAYDWRKEATLSLEKSQKELAKTTNPDYKASLEQDIERTSYHLDNDIPLNEGSFHTGLNYLHMSLVIILSGFLAFGLILFNADIMSGEYSPGTLKFLLIQPVTRVKVLLSKYLATVITSISLIVGVQLLFALGVGLIKGFGSFNYLILADERYKVVFEGGKQGLKVISGSGALISISSFLSRALLLEVLFIFSMVAFIMMVSVLSKSTVMAFTVLIGTLLGTNIAYGLSNVYTKLSPFIFLHHTDIDGIITGDIIQQTGALYFTYPLSLLVLTLSTSLFLSIAMVVFKKRDILI